MHRHGHSELLPQLHYLVAARQLATAQERHAAADDNSSDSDGMGRSARDSSLEPAALFLVADPASAPLRVAPVRVIQALAERCGVEVSAADLQPGWVWSYVMGGLAAAQPQGDSGNATSSTADSLVGFASHKPAHTTKQTALTTSSLPAAHSGLALDSSLHLGSRSHTDLGGHHVAMGAHAEGAADSGKGTAPTPTPPRRPLRTTGGEAGAAPCCISSESEADDSASSPGSYHVRGDSIDSLSPASPAHLTLPLPPTFARGRPTWVHGDD